MGILGVTPVRVAILAVLLGFGLVVAAVVRLAGPDWAMLLSGAVLVAGALLYDLGKQIGRAHV